MILRKYMINGFEEKRECFLNKIIGEITQEQYEDLLDGEEITVNGDVFIIKNVEGI